MSNSLVYTSGMYKFGTVIEIVDEGCRCLKLDDGTEDPCELHLRAGYGYKNYERIYETGDSGATDRPE